MRLSAYTDYSIRVLKQTAIYHPRRLTVPEMAETFGISANHLMKIVHDLARNGHLATQRGAGGRFTLAWDPEQIRLGDIVRLGEEHDTVIAGKAKPNVPTVARPPFETRAG